MTPEALQEYRRQQTLIVEQLCRINGRASGRNYGLAGRLLKLYRYDLVLELLGVMQEGTPVPYMMGALRKAAERRAVYSELIDTIAEAWE